MYTRRLHFIDWMKAIGIVLIVYGHVAGSTINFMTPPILAKQIGVSCFLFVLAYVLARERRAGLQVMVRRLFKVYFVGISAALLLSLWGLMTHKGPELSDYLPFLAGANVLMLMNAFPADPTTWYIATYVHVILLWALFGRHLRVRVWMLVCAAAGEIAVRILLADTAGPFAAYTALPNWLTVLLWGAWISQNSDKEPADLTRWQAIGPPEIVFALFLLLWPIAGAGLRAYPGFPFETIGTNAPLALTVFASAMVTILYVGYADCLFRLTRVLPAPLPVRFLARNTLVIFIWHWPIFQLLQSTLEPRLGYWAAASIILLVCLPGLGLLSEGAYRILNTDELRDRVLGIVIRRPELEISRR